MDEKQKHFSIIKVNFNQQLDNLLNIDFLYV